MRRFIVFIAAALVLVTSKIYPSELKKRENLGAYTAFDNSDKEVVSLVRRKYDRLDFDGGESAAMAFMRELDAKILFSESAGGTEIYYCHTKKIPAEEVVSGKKVNLVVAVHGERVSVGSPLLKGSY